MNTKQKAVDVLAVMDRSAEVMCDEAAPIVADVDVAADLRDGADELEAEVERLKKELNNRPTYGDVLEMRSALEWIAKGNTTKADMIAAAKEALADVAQRQLEATKAA
jgi:hypothetical protein